MMVSMLKWNAVFMPEVMAVFLQADHRNEGMQDLDDAISHPYFAGMYSFQQYKDTLNKI